MIYTSGDWHVAAGREDEFVSAWHRFAQWSVREIDHTAQATLLRDHDDQRHFISFGAWKDEETVDLWRASEGYGEQMPKLKAMTESAKVTTLEVAAATELLTATR